MTFENEVIIASMLIAASGGAFIPVWQAIRGKVIPELVIADEADEAPATRYTKDSKAARLSYMAVCAILSAVVGIAMALYWLGFYERSELPNFYARGFYSLIAGFMMHKILLFIDAQTLGRLVAKLKAWIGI